MSNPTVHGQVATLGHPANGVVINDGLNHGATTTTSATTVPVTQHQTVTHQTTTAHQPAAAPMAATAKHTVPSGATGDGLVVASNLGGPMGGTVVLGGQCECTRNGGTCAHGAGQCSCRGCTTAATSLNPGINIGVSTHQYTAPVGTSGIGGGVASPGVGMAGVVNATNPVGQPVSAAVQNCDCVREKGVCNCAPGQCKCTNCTAHRKSMAATQATGAHTTTTTTHHTTAGTATTTHHSHHHGHHGHHSDAHAAASGAPLAGSEYVGGQQPNYTYASTTGGAPVSGGITGSAQSDVPLTDNSNVPYTANDYISGKPVDNNRVI